MAVSHSLTVRSELTVASVVPSGEYASAFTDPILTTLQAPLQAKASQYQSRVQSDLQQAKILWQKATGVQPADANLWRFLANDAIQTQDYATAITALRKFLKLEPNAPEKKQFQQYIKQLEPLAKTQATTPSGTTSP